MATPNLMLCDGCGLNASPEHISRRLKRLEWSTRFRPVHINALLFGAFSPEPDAEFLYSAPDIFQGEAARVLDALGVPYIGKSADTVLVDFQRRGFFLVHVLGCAAAEGLGTPPERQNLLDQRLPFAFTRIRRSLKPRRVVPLSSALEPLVNRFVESDLGCPVLLDNGKPFALEGVDAGRASMRLRAALASVAAFPQ